MISPFQTQRPPTVSASAAYIKVVDRINNMESLNRSGDIVLLMKDSTSGNEVDRYSTGYSCKSWHGSLNPGDSYVPFIVTYPGGNRFEIEPRVNATSGCNTTQGCEGNWKVTDLTKKIIKGQY